MLPLQYVGFYNLLVRPLTFIVLALGVYVFWGLDKRPIPKKFETNIASILSVLLFITVIIVLSFSFGAGRNAMTVNSLVIARNLWIHALVIILGEFLRFQIVKNSKNHIICIITIALAYNSMSGIEGLVYGINFDIFFEQMFAPLVISAVLSYFALKGSFASVVLVSFIYGMAPFLSPILPVVSPIAYSLIVSLTIFVSLIIYIFIVNDRNKELRLQEKRTRKYTKKPIAGYAINILLVSGVVAFFAGFLPIYPIVVLTDSMEGAFDRGSIVFVERVPRGQALERVGEGYVIHFLGANDVPYVHRVVNFQTDARGQRQYITRGDNSYAVDPFYVTQEDVLGIVRASLPFVGYPYLFFRGFVR